AYGNKLTTEDPLHHVVTTVYDSLGRLRRVENTAGVTQYSYYASGLLKDVRDANNKVMRYEYDQRGSVTTITQGLDGSTEPAGTAAAQQTLRAYDLRGNLKS